MEDDDRAEIQSHFLDIVRYAEARGAPRDEIVEFLSPADSSLLHQPARYWYWTYIRAYYNGDLTNGVYACRTLSEDSDKYRSPVSKRVGCISCNTVYPMGTRECGCGYSMLIRKRMTPGFDAKLKRLHAFWSRGILEQNPPISSSHYLLDDEDYELTKL